MGAGDGGEIEGRLLGLTPGIAFSNEHEPQIFRATDPKIETLSCAKDHNPHGSKTGDFEKRIHISHNCIKVARSFPCQKMVDETHGRVFMPMFTIVILKYDCIAI